MRTKASSCLMRGADLDGAAKLAGRVSGDSTVAYAIAFARAAEAALGMEVPPRAHWLRALMAELERLANHLGDIGAICNDASFSLMQAHCAVLRERVLAGGGYLFRSSPDARLRRARRRRAGPGWRQYRGAARASHRRYSKRFPALVELYDNTASLQDRTVATGILKPHLAQQFGAGGICRPRLRARIRRAAGIALILPTIN